LTVIDTPGFGDFVNNEDSWKPIFENIEGRYDAFLEQENRVNRKRIVDTRVHACLYFIAPTGHSLKPIDIEFMKRLANRVNLIPVIAKSDTLTEEEIKAFKVRILEDIAFNKIQIYQPPVYETDDPETMQENRDIIVYFLSNAFSLESRLPSLVQTRRLMLTEERSAVESTHGESLTLIMKSIATLSSFAKC
jgi:septin 7